MRVAATAATVAGVVVVHALVFGRPLPGVSGDLALRRLADGDAT